MSSRPEPTSVTPSATRPLARAEASTPERALQTPERALQTPERAVERAAPVAPNADATPFDVRTSAKSSSLKRSGARWRLTSRVLGAACFVIGAGLLLWTFLQAAQGLQAFARPDYLSRKFNTVAGDGTAAALSAAIVVVGAEVLRVLYLLLMGAFASLLAARGAQFFASSDAVIDEAMETS